jgi:CDP-glycerol glycerophosphotransferase (TagB/SpsB family)
MQQILSKGTGHLAEGMDVCPYLAAADVMLTDHSSAGFEYLLLDRPLIRIHVPELLSATNANQDYVRLLADASDSVEDVDGAVAAVERALVDPASRSASRRAVAQELFYQPGTATARAVAEVYQLLELTPAADRVGAEAKAPALT